MRGEEGRRAACLGDGVTISEGDSGSRPENNGLIQISSDAVFLLLLAMKQNRDKHDNHDSLHKGQFSERHMCHMCHTHT